MPPTTGHSINGTELGNGRTPSYQQLLLPQHPAPHHHQSNNEHQPHRSSNGRAPRNHVNRSGGEDVRVAATTRSGMMNGNSHNDVTVMMNADVDMLRGHETGSQPTPMFERLVTEEVQELKTYVRIVETQNRRLAELEKVQSDLENRLEIESVCRQQLEATLEKREREWVEKIEHIESDRDQWKNLVESEKLKNSKLIDQVVRKDQDIHRMLQRKYDHESTRSVRGVRASENEMLKSVRMSRNTTENDTTRSIRNPRTNNDNVSTEISRSVRSNIVRPLTSSERRSPASAISTSKSPEGGRIYDRKSHKGPHEILAAAGSVETVRHRNVNSLLMEFFGI